MDGIPEIVAGRTAYRANGDIYWDHPELSDGWIAVADFDDDPFPEVVLVANGNVFLFEHSGEIQWGPVPIDPGATGGPPLVADLDNDGKPEIGVAGRQRYQVLEHTGVIKWSVPVSDTSSEITGSSAFDFEADGFSEVVYADERRLRVFDGTDGTVVFETEIGSATRLEYPIVADVDVDGKAEIVVVANEFNNPIPLAGIFVYGTPSERWVPTRSIWNQHTYHITNINEDGTIPARESNNWELFNNYRQNVLIDGCVYALPDLTASFVRKETVGSDVVLTGRIGNGGGNAAGPASGGILLGTSRTESIAGRQFRDVSLIVPVGTEALPLWVVADDEGGLVGLHTESDETNNAVDGQVFLTSTPNLAPVVDAGPDQVLTLEGASLVVSLAGSVTDDGLPTGVVNTV